MQIFGASSDSMREYKNSNIKSDDLLISDKQNGFSTPPDTVNTRMESPDLIKK